MSRPIVGADFESMCRKCGDVWHVVIAMEGARVIKVQCKQCGGLHRPRPPGGKAVAKTTKKKAKKATTKKKTTRRKAAAGPELIEADPDRDPRPYATTEFFSVGDTVDHKAFGRGVVQTLPGPGKVKIHFPDGMKLLIQAK